MTIEGYNADMDTDLLKTIIAADAQPAPRKWRVKRSTIIRSKPVVGRQLGNCPTGYVFISNWIVMGWIAVDGQNNRWIKTADIEEVFDVIIPDPQPEPAGDYYRLLHDFELPDLYRKDMRSGVPETVRFAHEGNGNIKFTKELQEAMYELNSPLEDRLFSKLFDTWNRIGEKFSEVKRNYITGECMSGEYPKYPFELSFGGNTIRARRVLNWAGGMGIAKGTVVIECDTLNPNNLPDLPSLIGTPYIHHMTTVVNKNVNPFPYRGGRDGLPCYTAFMSPVTLYIEAGRCVKVDRVVRPYAP
jgi:hypothetical protein